MRVCVRVRVLLLSAGLHTAATQPEVPRFACDTLDAMVTLTRRTAEMTTLAQTPLVIVIVTHRTPVHTGVV